MHGKKDSIEIKYQKDSDINSIHQGGLSHESAKQED